MGLMVIRLLLVIACGWIGYAMPPAGVGASTGLVVGLGVAAAIIGLEIKLRRLPTNVLIGGIFGTAVGLLIALGFTEVVRRIGLPPQVSLVLQVLGALVFGYLGLVIGSKKGEWVTPKEIVALFSDRDAEKRYKILDTSVIIDGRIAEVCATGFVEGVLVVPQFVLAELQAIADSADSLKRNRGRRGLDILQRLQKNPDAAVQISETDFPGVAEVDLKLIRLAGELDGKIVTNDSNLSKVAQLRGVPALNINELASALKPVVLPGERMSVYLLKEGKEPGQAVGYLDDGTMVVAEESLESIGSTIEIEVTSVLQTTAGKMIFGKPQATAATEPSAPVGAER